MGGFCTKRTQPAPAVYHTIVNQHEARCHWLKDDNFLRDLESDSVDSEVLDEELRSLELREHTTCRGRTLKVVDSSPLQIAMCILVLFDAAVVVAEILLDLHVIRSQSRESSANIAVAVDFLRDAYPDELAAYSGDSLPEVVDLLTAAGLRRRHSAATTTVTFDPLLVLHRRRRFGDDETDDDLLAVCRRLQISSSSSTMNFEKLDRRRSLIDVLTSPTPTSPSSPGLLLRHRVGSGSARNERRRHQKNSWKRHVVGFPTEMAQTVELVVDGSASVATRHDADREDAGVGTDGRKTDETATADDVKSGNTGSKAASGPSGVEDVDETLTRLYLTKNAAANSGMDSTKTSAISSMSTSDDVTSGDSEIGNTATAATKTSTVGGNNSERSRDTVANNPGVDAFLKLAHILHYGSIAILGVFVLQVFVKLIAMGCEFFRQRMEIFDAVIVLTSFVLDIVFFEGVTGPDGEQAAAIIMIFLLWRILRIVNGVMLTTKNRQDFRIRLQKRARLRLEKKVENLRDELDWHEKQALGLFSLCREKGATEEEIVTCKPRRRTVVQMTTTSGLSSIASLSLGLSMSMSVSSAGPAAKDRLDAALSSVASHSPAAAVALGRARRSSSLAAQVAAGRAGSSASGGSVGGGSSGGGRPPMRRQSAVSVSSTDASVGTLSPVQEQDGSSSSATRSRVNSSTDSSATTAVITDADCTGLRCLRRDSQDAAC